MSPPRLPHIPHSPSCRPALPSKTLPARPCQTTTLTEVVHRLERVEALLGNQVRLRCKEVCQRYGIHRATLYRQLKTGRFPKPIYVVGGPHWPLADLEAAEKAGRIGKAGQAEIRPLSA